MPHDKTVVIELTEHDAGQLYIFVQNAAYNSRDKQWALYWEGIARKLDVSLHRNPNEFFQCSACTEACPKT